MEQVFPSCKMVKQALGLSDPINLINVPDKCKLPLAHLPHYEAVFWVEGNSFTPPHTWENTAFSTKYVKNEVLDNEKN